jgi:hypothetical protein
MDRRLIDYFCLELPLSIYHHKSIAIKSYLILKSGVFGNFGGVLVVAKPGWSLSRDFCTLQGRLACDNDNDKVLKKSIRSPAILHTTPKVTTSSKMPPQLSEDEIDDVLYYARTGDLQELTTLSDKLCKREHTTLTELLLGANDPYSGNGPLHMAAANGHTGTVANNHGFKDKPLISPQKSSPTSSQPSQHPSRKTPPSSHSSTRKTKLATRHFIGQP